MELNGIEFLRNFGLNLENLIFKVMWDAETE